METIRTLLDRAALARSRGHRHVAGDLIVWAVRETSRELATRAALGRLTQEESAGFDQLLREGMAAGRALLEEAPL